MNHAESPRAVVPLHSVRDAQAPEGATAGPSVEVLVECAQRGELPGWALLYRGHYAGVLRHLCCLVGSREQAEDLAQETFARAISAIGTFSGTASFPTWLHGVALNVARGHWRAGERRARAQAQLELIEATQELREGDLDRAHQRKLRVRVLFTVLDELTEALREAFVLRYIEGLSAGETAERLGIEAGTVRVRAHRARSLVEDRLRDLGWASPTGGAT